MPTVEPSEFVRPGNVVVVVTAGSRGASAWKRREVAKVGAQHFTVEGVESGGKPVRFRNREGAMVAAIASTVEIHEAAADHLGMYVIEDGTEAAEQVRAQVTELRAVQRVARAADAWRKIEGRRTSVTDYNNRPTAAEVDAALVEVAAAAVELRGILGVPEGVEA